MAKIPGLYKCSGLKIVTTTLLFVLSLNMVNNANDLLWVDTYAQGVDDRDIAGLYQKLASHPNPPSFEVVLLGMSGYYNVLDEKRLENSRYVTLIDYSMPSTSQRLWVIDITTGEIVYNSLVAHGRKSGDDTAKRFSNTPGSNMSSLGYFVTGEVYQGRHGLSLILDGIENNINDKARARAIVMHGASYATPEFIKEHGRLGRSLGCPAIPPSITKELIDLISQGSLLFIYYPDNDYMRNSSYLNHLMANSNHIND